jgi:adenine-specific DNA-methyltransferase
MQAMYERGEIVKRGRGLARKYYLTDAKNSGGATPNTWWDSSDTATHGTKEIQKLMGMQEIFSTPKPEKLIYKIIYLATEENDLILDSFLGSGTTAAVAHKMGRRWIGIEAGDHAVTHCIPRLQKVIEGEQGGISQSVNWQGGGGFSFYTLGATVFLDNGHINPQVRFAELANYLWHVETRQLVAVQPQTTRNGASSNPTEHIEATPLLGVNNGTAYYLLYNGILKDRRPESGNVLTPAVWRWLESLSQASKEVVQSHVVYGEARLGMGEALLAKLGIEFKQMPYKLQKI